MIVDRNELQSDKPTEEILALGDLEAKLRAFGWHVATCDGHDHAALRAAFASFARGRDDVPKALVAHTIKGKGVSFMEHPRGAARRAAAPTAGTRARRTTTRSRARTRSSSARIADARSARPAARRRAAAAGGAPTSLEGEPESGDRRRAPKVTDEYVAAAYGEALLELAEPRAASSSCSTPTSRPTAASAASSSRIRTASSRAGIAEQDMVSAAAGLARHGLLPVVNSFASFLASRANEQIYNQASERTKVVYALHYAGLIPAGPGKSHQSIRDVSLLAALPDMTIVQPANAAETRALAARGRSRRRDESVAIRLAIGPSPRRHRAAGGEVAAGAARSCARAPTRCSSPTGR